jgi:hypothetical protein
MVAGNLPMSYGIRMKMGSENGKPLVIQTDERPKSSEPRRKKSLGWAMLSLAL